MKPIVLFFMAMMMLLGMAFAQDPVIPEDKVEDPTVCEPYLKANYTHDAQTLTIFYEDCDIVSYVGCWFGWCGTMTEQERINYEKLTAYYLTVTNLSGHVVYKDLLPYGFEKELEINNLNLEAGAYLLLLKKPGGEVVTHKFGVR